MKRKEKKNDCFSSLNLARFFFSFLFSLVHRVNGFLVKSISPADDDAYNARSVFGKYTRIKIAIFLSLSLLTECVHVDKFSRQNRIFTFRNPIGAAIYRAVGTVSSAAFIKSSRPVRRAKPNK